ncbi:MAG: YibE/F family protein [bacterium]|nr:YibE/F family protein [bacterium]
MKRIILLFFVILMTQITILAQGDAEILPSAIGKIQRIEYIDYNGENDVETKQSVDIKILNGDYKGNEIRIENQLTGNPYYDIHIKEGLKVILHVENDNGNIIFSIEDIYRSSTLLWLSVLFGGLLVYVGKKKGLYSLVAIGLTAILILKGLSPLILFGIDPIIGTLIISLLSTAITIYFVGGFNRKSSSAIIGCLLSLIIASLLAVISVKTASLTGFTNENISFLYSSHPELNFVNLVVAIMILASLGAVMDVGMSIASTINEIYVIDNTKTFKELFVSGMNVGRDVIGTMANTLILVYLGASLPLILLANNIDMIKFINLNQIVTEIASALIGSCAIIICVPFTAFIAAKLVRKHKVDQEINISEF